MANTLVEGAAATSEATSGNPLGPYWHNISIGAEFYVDADLDLKVRRTTDKGSNWAETNIFTGSVQSINACFDKDTPGNTGTLVRLSWMDFGTDRVYYVEYDLSDGTIGTVRNLADIDCANGAREHTSIAVSRAGNAHIEANVTASAAKLHLRSDDGFVTHDSLTSAYETDASDRVELFPANTSDPADICCIFEDDSADAISVKMWDNSAGTWTETAIVTVTAVDTARRTWDGVVRLSDGHLMIAGWTAIISGVADGLAYDLTVDDIVSPTVTAKTNVRDNEDMIAMCCVMNHQNDRWYVGWVGGATQSAAIILYRFSDDGGGTWSGDQTYSENADDFRMVHHARGIFNTGGRLQFSFFETDLDDIWINEVNDVEIDEFIPPPVTFVPSVMIV